ncbi:NAD(P)-dependent oxidoreductase [Streptomyces sp. NPDC102283]|uniref:NAD(P)-dependent oxidoreductase n=1 Tax=Streptomyces sp. NPDC102283 TaxID=3366155 RepID=UPI00381FD2B1
MSTDPTGTTVTPVTVAGLGLMGSALAAAFTGQGHPTTVWNRTPAKCAPLVEQGATAAGTVADAVTASPVVILCLSDYEAVRGVLEPVREHLAGRVLVNLTSGTPQEARETAAWAAEQGARYLDGAIMAIPQLVGSPDGLFFYAGDAEAFTTHEQTLRVLGGNTLHLGADHGLPSLYDVALLGMMWSALGGYIQAVALVGSEGISAQDFLAFSGQWLDHVVSPMLPDLAREMDERAYGDDTSSLHVNKDAIAHLVETGRAQGVGTDMALPMQALIERRIAQGHGSDGLASLVELLRNPSS